MKQLVERFAEKKYQYSIDISFQQNDQNQWIQKNQEQIPFDFTFNNR